MNAKQKDFPRAYAVAVLLVPPGAPLAQENLFLTLNIAVLGLLYAWGVARMRHRGGWHTGQTVSFFLGLALLCIAAAGPPMAWAHLLFWPHMVQHLLIMMLAVPFIVLGNPITLLVWATDGIVRRTVVRILRSRAVVVLTNPVLTWLLFAATLFGTHVPVVMEWSLQSHHAMHAAIFPLYVVAAFLFYAPLIGGNLLPRRPRHAIRVISLGLMMIPETVLGIVIHLSPVVLYPSYETSVAALGVDPLTDQKFAGALAWALTMVIDGIWAMIAAWEWFRDEERRAVREEALVAA